MPPYRNYIYEYHAKITSGEIIAGKWIKKIYEIIINGLQKQEYFFNAKAANKAIRFIENFCHHSKGRNDLIKLELWQKAIVSVIFGIQDAEKIRIFREIFIVIGRKNGKSLFASAIIAYMAYLEPEYGQEIYCLAPKLDQAALVYDGFYQMVQAEDELAELAKKRRSDIYIAESNTVIKPIAFNAKKSDGFNPQLVVCDEMAAWSGDAGLKQYEVMKSALGARTQPMILSISTAGYINDSIYDELMKRSTSFLKGNNKERRLLPFLYMIDDVEKWNDIDELKKANPNMGVSVKESFFMDEIAVAEGSLSKKAEFLTKYCNIKQNSSIAWLEYQTVENAGVEKTLEDFRVFARQSNNTLILEPDVKGLFVAADLSRTDLARGLYQDISAGMITKMSWAFTVAEESYDRETHTRTILKIKKVYDVSAVSIPANNDTEISARAFASRSYERERQELLKRRAAILKIKASL